MAPELSSFFGCRGWPAGLFPVGVEPTAVPLRRPRRLSSIRERVGATNFNLHTANRLFREGDYPAALGIYLWLGQQRPLPMYGDNAVRAANRTGMPWVKAADELAWITSVNQ